jgi:hypothetical protein
MGPLTSLRGRRPKPSPAHRLRSHPPLLFYVILAAGLVAGSCKRTRIVAGCVADADCGDLANLYCDKATGYCLCKTDTACPSGEVCNGAGYCVPQSRCTTNADCGDAGLYCETVSSTCVQPGRCALDTECPFGQICDLNTSTCQPGCRTQGDCPLGQVCACKDASGAEYPCHCPAVGDVSQICPQVPAPDGGYTVTAPGQCLGGGRCWDTSGCPFGDTCLPPDGGSFPYCVNTYDPELRPYCDNCVDMPGGTDCGQGQNFCLTAFDPVTDQAYDYCGVDCSQGQPCPNGYFCKPIMVVYGKWECTSDSDCNTAQARSTLPCQQDSDCPNGGMCGIDPGSTTGFCYGPCYRREGVTTGFCSCVIDSDCFQDSCDSVTDTCTVSKLPCDPNTGGCVQQVYCVDMGGRGGCLIGYNCATITGLTCNDIKRDGGFQPFP